MKHWDLPEDWEIEAALPEYVDGEGDATRLFLADGTDRLVRARLRTVLERLARRHCRSLPLLRAWAKERTALAQTAPLAIASELVLVPFRARRPRIRGDAAMGVVNAMHAQLVRAEESAEIELSCGRRIRALWGAATLAAHLRAAEILRQDLDAKTEAAVLRRLFWQKIDALSKRGTTVIITTHFMEEAEYCTRILIQDHGTMLVLGSPAEIRARMKMPAADMNDVFIRIVEEARRREEAIR